MTTRFQSLLLSIGDIWNVVVAGAVGNWISVRESMGWTYLFDAKMSRDNQSCFPWINIRREDIDLSWMARTSLGTADAFPVVASLPPKNSVREPEQQTDFPWRKTFCFDVGLSDQRIEYSWSVLDFGESYQIRFGTVNFTTITRFPETLNADFFMKQLLLKQYMWCEPLVSLCTWHKQNLAKIIATEKEK